MLLTVGGNLLVILQKWELEKLRIPAEREIHPPQTYKLFPHPQQELLDVHRVRTEGMKQGKKIWT